MFDRLTVVAINGSPHGAIGSTSQMIQMIGAALAQESIALEEIKRPLSTGITLATPCWDINHQRRH